MMMNEATNTTLANSLNLPTHLKLHHAFLKVDRGLYFSNRVRDSVPNSIFYANRPMKFGIEHQSAPFIYAKALSALEIEGTEPLQFLNVGTGTGYVHALLANVLPQGSVLHGIELNPELSAQTEERFRQLHSASCEMSSFFVGNVFDIDVERNILYDRIYVGAGLKNKDGSSVESFFLSMLKPGGILVAPVGSSLLKMVQTTQDGSGECSVSMLHHVRFVQIVRSDEDEDVAPRLVLQCAVWDARRHIHCTYSAAFQRAVIYLHLLHRFGYAVRGPGAKPPPAPVHHRVSMTQLACVEERPAFERVPVELWREIIKFCSRSWFVVPADQIRLLKKLLAEETARRRVAEEGLQAARQQCLVLQGQLSHLQPPQLQLQLYQPHQHQHEEEEEVEEEDEEDDEYAHDNNNNNDVYGGIDDIIMLGEDSSSDEDDGDGDSSDGDGDGDGDSYGGHTDDAIVLIDEILEDHEEEGEDDEVGEDTIE